MERSIDTTTLRISTGNTSLRSRGTFTMAVSRMSSTATSARIQSKRSAKCCSLPGHCWLRSSDVAWAQLVRLTNKDNSVTPGRQRIRLTYEKGEAIKLISHADEFGVGARSRPGLPCSTSRASTRSRTSSSHRRWAWASLA